MAERSRRSGSVPPTEYENSSFGGKGWFLASWACATLAAVGLALTAVYSDTGWRRLAQAESVTAESPRISVVEAAKQPPRPSEAEIEARRLNEAVRVLASDRDRLMARISSLERSLDDVTGSIAAGPAATRKPPPEPSAPPAPPAMAAAAPPAVPAPASGQPTTNPAGARKLPGEPAAPSAQTPATSAAVPQAAAQSAVQAAAVPDAPPFPPPVPGFVAAPTGPGLFPTATGPASVFTMPPAIAPLPAPSNANSPGAPAAGKEPTNAGPHCDSGAAASVATRTEFGVDIGGAGTVGGLRALWVSLKGAHESLLGDLRPVIGIRDNGKVGAVQLRLVAGPLADAGAAARLCASLAATGLACQTTIFDGQRLALR